MNNIIKTGIKLQKKAEKLIKESENMSNDNNKTDAQVKEDAYLEVDERLFEVFSNLNVSECRTMIRVLTDDCEYTELYRQLQNKLDDYDNDTEFMQLFRKWHNAFKDFKPFKGV